MSSETPSNDTNQSILDRIMPFIFGIRVELPESRLDPDDNSSNNPTPDESNRIERILLINSLIFDLDTLIGVLQGKGGQPPASKSAVDALPRVEIKEEDEKKDCVICLEEFNVGSFVKKMPCHHGFHEGCIEKWLGIHGNCPVCRYNMPVDEAETKSVSGEEEGNDGGRVNREIWVGISIVGRRRGVEDEMVENGSDDTES